MFSPKIRPPGSYDVSKSRQSVDERILCFHLRYCLLAWAFLRLIVSTFWTGLLCLSTVWTFTDFDSKNYYYIEPQYLIPLEFISILAQLVEFGMLVTFIVAGFKKSVELYRIYYRYCLLTIGIYIVVVTLVLLLGYEYGHYLAEMYITYHFVDFGQLFAISFRDEAKVFLFVSVIDILLEVLLISLVKKMIARYQGSKDAETV